MNARFASVPPRSLAGWKTAYPRASKLGSDPANGLASIEALYVAFHILGRSTAGLLDQYRWADQFLEFNDLPKPSDVGSDSRGASTVSS
jgi:pre-rRNA-processing protein TSR3